METEHRLHYRIGRVRRYWQLAAALFVLGVLFGGCPMPDTFECDPKLGVDKCSSGSVPH